MIYNSKPGRHGYTLLEIMLVIGITAVLLGMMMYRHMYSIDRSTFNNEAQTFASEVKSLSNMAKKIGMLTPASLLNQANTEKDDNIQTVQNSGYCVWAILNRKTGTNVSDPSQVVRKGILTSRKPVKVAVSRSYTDATTTVTCGAWLELYTITDLKQYESVTPGSSRPIARVIYTPRGTPLVSGSIVIGYIEKDKVTRGVRLDLERNGSIGYSEGDFTDSNGSSQSSGGGWQGHSFSPWAY